MLCEACFLLLTRAIGTTLAGLRRRGVTCYIHVAINERPTMEIRSLQWTLELKWLRGNA